MTDCQTCYKIEALLNTGNQPFPDLPDRELEGSGWSLIKWISLSGRTRGCAIADWETTSRYCEAHAHVASSNRPRRRERSA